MTDTEIYIIVTTIIGVITYIGLLIFSRSNVQRREMFPWFVVIPFSFWIVPLVILGLFTLGAIILFFHIIPDLLFPVENDDYE